MSYAGPASRGKRAPEMESSIAGHVQRSELTPQPANPRWPSRSSRRDQTTAFAAGIAIGLAVGAGIALLFAPQSGEDTREAIADRGRRLAHRGSDAWDDLRDELQDAMRNRRAAWRRNGRERHGRKELV
jgi:hypothetical protein